MLCWCGTLLDDEDLDAMSDELPERCGGLGVVHCECGGDHLCVCHNHGEVECLGCPDCEEVDEDWI